MTSDSTSVTVQVDKTSKKPKTPKKVNKTNRIRLLSMLFLTSFYFLVELFVGYFTNSVALVADAFHMLSDVISLVIAYLAVRMSPKKWSQNTYGWARAEVLGALVNAVFLIALCFTIAMDAIERFLNVEEIKDPFLILVVGSIGLLVNLIGLLIFREHGHVHGHGGHGHSHGGHHNNGHSHDHSRQQHSHDSHFANPAIKDDGIIALDLQGKPVDLVKWTDLGQDQSSLDQPNQESSQQGSKKGAGSSASQMNMHGVFLHVLSDALGSVIVIISALIIWLTEWEYRMYIDPLLSLIMVIIMMFGTWPLLVESARVLLQTVPTHIQIDDLKKRLLSKVPGVQEVHEFHIWQLSGNRIIASAHILCSTSADFMRIGEQVKEFFHHEGIHSTTIQLEFPVVENSSNDNVSIGSESDIESDSGSDCFLTCPVDEKSEDCASSTCCGMQRRKNIIQAARMMNSNGNGRVEDREEGTSDSCISNANKTGVNVNTGFVPDS